MTQDDATQADLDEMFDDLIGMIRLVHELPENLEVRAGIAMHMASYVMAYAVSSVLEGGHAGGPERATSFVANQIARMVLAGFHQNAPEDGAEVISHVH